MRRVVFYNVNMSTATRITTADELLHMPDDGFRYELIEGELRKMTPAGSEHGFLSNEISWLLTEHVRQNDLGQVFCAETGFLIGRDPDTVLAPDTSFVRKERIAVFGIPKEYFPEAPALVVEVISPSDTAEEVDDKMRRWFAAGVELGWVIHPSAHGDRLSSVDDIRILTANDTLDGGSVVPGFLPLATCLRAFMRDRDSLTACRNNLIPARRRAVSPLAHAPGCPTKRSEGWAPACRNLWGCGGPIQRNLRNRLAAVGFELLERAARPARDASGRRDPSSEPRQSDVRTLIAIRHESTHIHK
jgi:Uma2 family endonuclease